MMAASADCSSSNTRAGPVITGFFRPVILATQPSGDRLPFRMARWPSAYIGLSIGRITSWSARGASGTSARFSATVLPVIVMQSPCSRPASSSTFITCRDAAGAVQVDRQVLAAGLQVAQHRHLAAHALEVVDRPFDLGRVRDGQEVQHRVGRAAGGHDHRHRVLDRLLGDDVARLQVGLHRLDQHARRVARCARRSRPRRWPSSTT